MLTENVYYIAQNLYQWRNAANIYIYIYIWGSLHDVVAYMLDCDNTVSKFRLQSGYYIHFWTNTLGKDMNLFP